MSDFVVHYFFNYVPVLSSILYSSGNFEAANRAFLFGDAVSAFFYFRNGQFILGEESYFYLMACMRKMRMNIPLDYTLDFFENLFRTQLAETAKDSIVIRFMAYRSNVLGNNLVKAPVSYAFSAALGDILLPGESIELDLMKEIHVNTNLLSNIQVHCPENIYAQIYAAENDLDDVILLNPFKRIARTVKGNLLLLEGNSIRIPKQSEGAYISPLMENFVTFLHKNQLAEIEEAELIAFETQKAEEILVVSDEFGILPVRKIRNKEFGFSRYQQMLASWGLSLSV